MNAWQLHRSSLASLQGWSFHVCRDLLAILLSIFCWPWYLSQDKRVVCHQLLHLLRNLLTIVSMSFRPVSCLHSPTRHPSSGPTSVYPHKFSHKGPTCHYRYMILDAFRSHWKHSSSGFGTETTMSRAVCNRLLFHCGLPLQFYQIVTPLRSCLTRYV